MEQQYIDEEIELSSSQKKNFSKLVSRGQGTLIIIGVVICLFYTVIAMLTSKSDNIVEYAINGVIALISVSTVAAVIEIIFYNVTKSLSQSKFRAYRVQCLEKKTPIHVTANGARKTDYIVDCMHNGRVVTATIPTDQYVSINEGDSCILIETEINGKNLVLTEDAFNCIASTGKYNGKAVRVR